MSAENWAVWAWEDSEGVTRYIGCGPFTDDGHPAKKRWCRRFDNTSELNTWLQSLEQEPARRICGMAIMPKLQARKLAAIYKGRAGETLLSAAWASGGGPNKRVAYFATPNTLEPIVYESVRQAASEHSVAPSTITRRCQGASGQWRYLED